MIKLDEIKRNIFIPFKQLLEIIYKKYNCSLNDICKIISLDKYNYIIYFNNNLDNEEHLLTIDEKNSIFGDLVIKDRKINIYTVYS